jgi:hypothetical protein
MAATQDLEEGQNFWPGYVDTLVNMVMFLILLIVVLAMAVMFFSMKARNDALKSTVPLKDSAKAANEKVYPGMADEVPQNPTMEDMRNLVNRLKEKLYQSELRYKPSGLNPVLKPNETRMGKSEKLEDGTANPGFVPNGLNPVFKPDETKMGKSDKLEDASAKGGTLPSGVQDFALRPSTLIIRFRPGALDMTNAEAQHMHSVFVKHFDYAVGGGQNFVLTVDAAEGLSESNRMAFYRVAAVRNRLMAIAGVPASKISQKILAVPANAMTGTEALEVRITKVD